MPVPLLLVSARRWTVFAILLLALVTPRLATADSPWKAGVAKRVITPETSVWLAGYGSKRAPDGKLHELWMKALALESATGEQIGRAHV